MKIEQKKISQIISTLFMAHNMCKSDATELTQILIDSHLRGYPSHGLGRVPAYIRDIKNGKINIDAKVRVIKDAPSTAYLDSEKGIGPLQLMWAMELASTKAKKSGIGAVSLKNSNDIARLGSYVERPANEGLIALLFVNDGGGNPSVCPTGTTSPFFSTNPIAAGIPTNMEWPIIIDISTATVAFGKLQQAINWGENVPEGWLIERDGTSTTDPTSFFRENKPSAILPLGGLLQGHKGHALSLLVDILSGGLSGTGMSTGDKSYPESNGIFIMVINPDNFVGREELEIDVGELIQRIKKLPGDVRVPGERHAQAINNPSIEVEIDPITWNQIQNLYEAAE